jgi:hypothetical protein
MDVSGFWLGSKVDSSVWTVHIYKKTKRSAQLQAMLNDHPTVKKNLKTKKKIISEIIDYQWFREIVLAAGADDVGFVEIDRE